MATCVDILLIQPPIQDFYFTTKRSIPYGLASIAAALIEKGYGVSIFDALATTKSKPIPYPEYMQYLKKYYGRPDLAPFRLFHHYRHWGYSFEHIGKKAKHSGAFLVAVASLFTPYEEMTLRVAETVKHYHPYCHVVVGGHHPTAMPQMVLKSDAVDYALRGEGEVNLPLLADALKNGLPTDTIPGIVMRKTDGRLHIRRPAFMTSIDDYPKPAMALINQRYYRRRGKPCSVISTSRGCPLKCSYCAVSANSKIPYRRRSMDLVLKEMETAIGRHGARFIDFEDENISLDRKWFITFLEKIHRRFCNIDLELRAMNGLFPPSLDHEVILAMKRAGFKSLNLALGTIAPHQLKRFKRPKVKLAFESALNSACLLGMDAVGYILVGAPHQTAADSIQDLLFLAQRRVLAGVSVFYPAPGSQDYTLLKSTGLLPEFPALMRSSALPLEHSTRRKEVVTLVRLGRIINFMKKLVDQGDPLPEPRPFLATKSLNLNDSEELGKQLLGWFLYDGHIRGVTPEGEIYKQYAAHSLCQDLLALLRYPDKTIRISGHLKRG